MAISNVNINSSPADQAKAVLTSAASPLPKTTPNSDQQVSAVVSISKQGQALNSAPSTNQAQQSNQAQAANNGQTNPTTENRETRPGEAAEKPGIQMVEGEKNNTPSQGSRVNTYV